LDHNPNPLAKDLLILFALEAVGNLDSKDTVARDEFLAVAMYVFVVRVPEFANCVNYILSRAFISQGAAMPPYIHARYDLFGLTILSIYIIFTLLSSDYPSY
jgi:hypothetical protein